MALLVTKRDRNLLLGSRIISEYPVLVKFIKTTPNLQDTELHLLDEETKRFFKNIYRKVLNQASKEWVVDLNSVEYFSGDTMRCQLCGHRPIKNICVIENVYTKKRLKIGTECVKHFGISKDADIDKLIEKSKRIKRLEELDRAFPGIEREINEWELFIDKQPILVKKDVKEKYLELKKQVEEKLNSYIDPNTSEKQQRKLIKEIGQLRKNKRKEMQKIKDYVREYKDNPLAPSKQLIQKLKSKGLIKVIDMLEEDGIIRHRTLFRIKDEEFSKSLVKSYNMKLKNLDCVIEKVVFKGDLGYQYIYKKKPNIKLFCKHSDLCMCYYNFITGDEGDDINFEGHLKISEIYDEGSVENFLFELFNQIKQKDYVIDSIFYEYNDFFIYDVKNDLYYILRLDTFINDLLLDFFIKKQDFDDTLYKYILNACKKPESYENIKHHKEERKRMQTTSVF